MTRMLALPVLPFGRNSSRCFAMVGALLSLCMGCITVNVYFPEGAVQRAADDFVRDLYKSTPKPASGAEAPKTPSKPSSRFQFELIPSAHAGDEITLDTPTAQAIKGRMSSRVADLSAEKSKGVIGETNAALVNVKDSSKLALKDRAHIEKLVASENEDRKALYDELQSANKLNDRNQVKIRAHFSRAFQEHSPTGTWIQGESGGWTRK